jgi:thiol:disulfide interchange protein DsbD
MGALSALIVGPCVAAPLAAALIVIGSSGDPLRGGIALFALSLGMGAPLVVFGTFGARLLPRAGAWMILVKQLFGLLLLAVAVYLLARVVPDSATLALWALLALLAAGLVLAAGAAARTPGVRLLARASALVAAIYGGALLVGSATGADDPLRPLAGLGAGYREGLEFQRVKSVGELDRLLAQAREEGRLVMLDYYADWCVSCKEMERETFTDRRIRAALNEALLLQSDVTRYDDEDKALLQRFGLYGPPAILFFAPDGTERRDRRIIGFMDADGFEQHVSALSRS